METVARTPIAQWSDEDARLYEEALDAVSALMTDYTRRMGKSSEPDERKALRAEREELALLRQRLSPRDPDGLHEIIKQAEGHFAST
jgi:hypothetical protein